MVPGSDTVVLAGRSKEPARIAQAECSGHPWYVSRRFNTKHWQDTQYLHGDGIWRDQTITQGRFTGLFQDRDEALSAIAAFESRESEGGAIAAISRPSGSPLANLERIVLQAENRRRKGHGSLDEQS